MLGVIEFMGVGLLGWYVFSVIGSFCFSMAGNSYLKNSEAVPENYNFYPPTIFASLIPIFNVIFALRSLSVGWAVSRSESVRDLYKSKFIEMEKTVKKTVDEIMKMSREDEEDNEQ